MGILVYVYIREGVYYCVMCMHVDVWVYVSMQYTYLVGLAVSGRHGERHDDPQEVVFLLDALLDILVRHVALHHHLVGQHSVQHSVARDSESSHLPILACILVYVYIC